MLKITEKNEANDIFSAKIDLTRSVPWCISVVEDRGCYGLQRIMV